MLTAQEVLCLVPGPLWQSESRGTKGSVAEFAADALATEKRIGKGANLATDEPRYSTLCQRMEDAAWSAALVVATSDEAARVLAQGSVPAVALTDGLVRLIASRSNATPEGNGRLGLSFIPPDYVVRYRAALSDLKRSAGEENRLALRLELVEAAIASGAGLVEYLDPFVRIETEDSTPEPGSELAQAPPSATGPRAITVGAPDPGWPRNWAEAFRLASASVDEGIRTGSGFNPSNWPNMITTELLRGLVHPQAGSPTAIRVMYSDGSEGRPFPLHCLAASEAPISSDTLVLSAALLSMRHPELDAIVDFNWYRNARVSQSRTFAETDEYCYQVSRKRLGALPQQPVILHMYQTGLPPALMGFYRALTEHLRSDRRRLVVVPKYAKGDGYIDGTKWF